MSRHVTEDTVLRTYSLQVIGPDRWWGARPTNLPALLREIEENMTDMLPYGFRVVIQEWDEEETPNE